MAHWRRHKSILEPVVIIRRFDLHGCSKLKLHVVVINLCTASVKIEKEQANLDLYVRTLSLLETLRYGGFQVEDRRQGSRGRSIDREAFWRDGRIDTADRRRAEHWPGVVPAKCALRVRCGACCGPPFPVGFGDRIRWGRRALLLLRSRFRLCCVHSTCADLEARCRLVVDETAGSSEVPAFVVLPNKQRNLHLFFGIPSRLDLACGHAGMPYVAIACGEREALLLLASWVVRLLLLRRSVLRSIHRPRLYTLPKSIDSDPRRLLHLHRVAFQRCAPHCTVTLLPRHVLIVPRFVLLLASSPSVV